MEETLLIEQLKQKKTQNEAFHKLVNLYKERLYWHIRKIVLNHDDSDDVLQNTFIKVFKNIDKFKGDSKLYSWMYRIATNEAINFINKKSNLLNISSEELQKRTVDSLIDDVYFDGDDIQLKLQKAIAALPQKQQLVFNMRYFEEMSYDMISEILETSVGALKASYHHAKKKVELFVLNES